MKKIFSLVIILLLIFTASFSIVSCNKDNREYKADIGESDIALLTLFTSNSKEEDNLGLFNLGHSFLSLENLTDNHLKLNNMSIKPKSTITIGSWPILEHFGIWYNVESNYITNHDKYDGRLSITIGIDNDDISILSNFIKDYDTWSPINNCSRFALSFWNTVASTTEYIDKPLIFSPSYIAKELKKFDTCEINKNIKTDKTMGYFNNNSFVSFNIEGGTNESI